MTAPLDHRVLAGHLRSEIFRPPDGRRGPAERPRIGLELEAVPVERITRRIAPLEGPRGMVQVLRGVSSRREWSEESVPGAPRFRTPSGDVLSFEPGGQLEWASRPDHQADDLLERARADLGEVQAAAGRVEVDLHFVGVDPFTPELDAPLQVRAPRYLRMDRHFAAIGSWGRRMMRQSASVHVNLDWTADSSLQWKVANAAAPLLTAIFANSRFHEGRDTGHRSFRAAQWRRLAPGRTGIPDSGEAGAVCQYLEFALDAPAFLLGAPERPVPFRELLGREDVGFEEWRDHLTTLFPEVRPRGYLELRSLDAVSLDHMAAPVALLTGLLYDGTALREAEELLPPPSNHGLELAGRLGLGDPALAARAGELVTIAMSGAERLPSTLGPGTLEHAHDFFSAFTLRGMDPGDIGDPSTGWESQSLASDA